MSSLLIRFWRCWMKVKQMANFILVRNGSQQLIAVLKNADSSLKCNFD